MPRGTLGVLLVLGAAELGAQEPPAHLTICVTDAAARHFEAQVRYLLSASDSAGRAALAEWGLTPGPVDSVQLVTEEQACTLASIAYAGSAADARGMTAPFPVSVVRAPGRLLVQLGGREEVVVLDVEYRPVGRLSLRVPDPAASPPR
jgi:hypothetical protein